MTPIDPAQTASEDPHPPMAPPYVDENPNLESVRQGMDLAESEKRELVEDEYETEAEGEDEVSDSLDDIDRTLEDGGDVAPEISAIRVSGRGKEIGERGEWLVPSDQ